MQLQFQQLGFSLNRRNNLSVKLVRGSQKTHKVEFLKGVAASRVRLQWLLIATGEASVDVTGSIGQVAERLSDRSL